MIVDVIDPKHRERETGTVGLYVSGTLSRTTFDYLRVSPPPPLLDFTSKDGTPFTVVPFQAYAKGGNVEYRVRLAYCDVNVPLSTSGNDGLWIRVEPDDAQVSTLVTSPLLYVGCRTDVEASAHNLVTLRPNAPGSAPVCANCSPVNGQPQPGSTGLPTLQPHYTGTPHGTSFSI